MSLNVNRIQSSLLKHNRAFSSAIPAPMSLFSSGRIFQDVYQGINLAERPPVERVAQTPAFFTERMDQLGLGNRLNIQSSAINNIILLTTFRADSQKLVKDWKPLRLSIKYPLIVSDWFRVFKPVLAGPQFKAYYSSSTLLDNSLPHRADPTSAEEEVHAEYAPDPLQKQSGASSERVKNGSDPLHKDSNTTENHKPTEAQEEIQADLGPDPLPDYKKGRLA